MLKVFLKQNRKTGGERSIPLPAIGFGLLLLCAFVVLISMMGSDDAPCESLQLKCEQELRSDFASARSIACTGVLARLIVVAMDQDQDYAHRQCSRMLDLVAKVDDAKLIGRQQTKKWLTRIQRSLGEEAKQPKNDGPLRVTQLLGEWFTTKGGARRLRLRGLLRHRGTRDDLKNIQCESAILLSLVGRGDPRQVKNSLCHEDYFPTGGQITFSSQSAIVVGRDEIRQGTTAVWLTIHVRGQRPDGSTTELLLDRIPIPQPKERKAFKIPLPTTKAASKPRAEKVAKP